MGTQSITLAAVVVPAQCISPRVCRAIILCMQDFASPCSPDYRPRFCVETGSMDLAVSAVKDAAAKRQHNAYLLECAEQHVHAGLCQPLQP